MPPVEPPVPPVEPPVPPVEVVPPNCTSDGVGTIVPVGEVPSWPLVPSPQHQVLPSSVIAQVWEKPAEIAVARVRTGVGPSTIVPSAVPAPTSPEILRPQQLTRPVAVEVSTSTQVCPPPALIARRPGPDSTAGPTGVNESVVVPSPSWPNWFAPQQRTVPSPRMAQV